MTSFYEELNWEVNVRLRVEQDSTSVSIEYIFTNDSDEDDFYIGLLPKFHFIPYRLLKNDKKVLVESVITDGSIIKQIILEERLAKGVNINSDCFMPIPWTDQCRTIPQGNILKLKLSWVESGPKIDNRQLGTQQWTTELLLPISLLFLPLDLSGADAPTNLIVNYESIDFEIVYPEGTNFNNTPVFSYLRPLVKNLNLSISHIKDDAPSIKFSITPPKKKPFSDIRFELPVKLTVPIEIEERAFKNSLEKLKNYSSHVIVSVVDLRGSSIEAEKHRNDPNPVDYTLNFQRLARETFPDSLSASYIGDSETIKMKKVVGDMLMVVASVSLAAEVISETLKFTQKLTSKNIPFRAGFHVDQATDTGNLIYSLNEEGTDFLGPALNWAAKIGDDKSNSGIRITKPAVDKALTYLESQYDLESIGYHKKNKSLEIFDLKERKILTTPDSIHPGQELFSCKLNNRILKLNTRVCVGLDPDLNKFPKVLLEQYQLKDIEALSFNDINLTNVADCILSFNKTIIDLVCNDAVAIKPQSAHYERFGHHGILCLEKTVSYAKSKGLIVILDAKRNDIGSTAEKYALAYLGYDDNVNAAAIPFDAVTVNPYLGSDGIDPFVVSCEKNGKGIFVLVKTSNPSSGDLQDLKLSSDISLSHHIAKKVNEWGNKVIGPCGYSSVGAVIGATYPKEIKSLRKIMPKSIFLIPGYGAQGAKADNISGAFDENGLGAIINSARGITYCYSPEDSSFREKIKEQVTIMKNDINQNIYTLT